MSAPTPPPAGLGARVGHYGRADAILDIFELDGNLYARGHRFIDARLTPAGADTFVDTASGRFITFASDNAAVGIGSETLDRHDFGAEAIAAFQHSMRKAPLHRGDDGMQPPTLGTAPLESITRVVPSVRLDIRYAGSDNFMGYPIYDRAVAYARPAVAAALARVHHHLADQGFGLLVHDAYRPWSVTKLFWDAVSPEYRAFVADPAIGSRHNRGCAIDLTLRDLASGTPVEMPSRYDEPTTRARYDYPGGTSRQRWHRDLLRAAMEAHGFAVQPDEWWHFDFHAWHDYPIEDTPFAALELLAKGDG